MKATEAILAGVFAGGGSGGGGGGTGVMIVTVDTAWDTDIGDYVCTADKTVAEINAAFQNGIIPVAKVTGDFTESGLQDVNLLMPYHISGEDSEAPIDFYGGYASTNEGTVYVACVQLHFDRHEGSDDIFIEYSQS